MDELEQAVYAVRYHLETTVVPMAKEKQADFRSAVWRLLVAVEKWGDVAKRWKCKSCGCEFPSIPGDEDVDLCTPCATVKAQAAEAASEGK